MEKNESTVTQVVTTTENTPSAVNSKLTGKFEKQYRRTGRATLTFVYILKGEEAAINQYLADKKDYLGAVKDKDGVIRFYGARHGGINVDIARTEKDGKADWKIDSTYYDQLANLTAQFGIDVAKEMMKDNVTQ